MDPLPKALVHQLAQLNSTPSPKPGDLWKNAFKAPLPPKLKRVHVIACLSYRLQELQEGGLSQASQRQLKDLASEKSGASIRRSTPRIKSGTRLVRSWRGTTYLVTITNDGYLYAGRPYASLSVIAREITGARWSGPLFFGLKQSPLSAQRVTA